MTDSNEVAANSRQHVYSDKRSSKEGRTGLIRLTGIVRKDGHSLLANVSWLLFDRVTRILVAIVLGSLVARHLGPERYGFIVYALSLHAFMQVVVSLGLDGPAVREMSANTDQCGLIVGTVAGLRILTSIVCVFGVVIYAITAEDAETRWILLVTAMALPFLSADALDLFYQSVSQNRFVVKAKLFALALATSLRVVLILINGPTWAFAAALPVELAGTACLLMRYRREAYNELAIQFSHTWARQLLRESLPLLLSALATTVYMRIDIVMVRRLLGNTDLGYYAAAVAISSAPYVMPMLAQTAVLPKLSLLRSRDPEGYSARLQDLFDLSAATGYAVVAALYFFAPLIVRVLLGEKYAPAIVLLRVHAVTNLFVFLGVAQHVWVVVERRPRVTLTKTLVGVVTSIALNLWLMRRYGVVGGMASAVGTQAISAVLCNVFVAPDVFRIQLRALLPLHRLRIFSGVH